MKVLVAGATGYVGGRLVQRLLDEGHEVRVLARDRDRALGRPWGSRVEVAQGDLQRPDTLAGDFDGVDVAYYLVHSEERGPDRDRAEREVARNFVAAGQGLRQVIYLGVISPDDDTPDRSSHLSGRLEVGRILRDGLPTTEFRAGPIIGSGSAYFEMLYYLAQRIPAMVAPRWILNEVRPIAIGDILDYLVEALGRMDTLGVMDVGSDPVTVKKMITACAGLRGRRRAIQAIPGSGTRLAVACVGLVTPLPNYLARSLVEGLVEPAVGDTSRAESLFPDIEPRPYLDAVERALDRTERGKVATRWTSAGGTGAAHFVDRQGLARAERIHWVKASPDSVYRTFCSLGGERGWLVWDWAWEVRGFVDRILGGPGLRRGRRHPEQVYPGEALDFWRVEEVRRPELLRLRAEMKVPGRAWLQFEAHAENGGTRLVQTAFFAPSGIFGWAYWWSLLPIHALIFTDMVRAIARDAMALEKEPAGEPIPPLPTHLEDE